jgi:DNA-directed RNA polymerase subunit RPC12/RpoP
VLTLLLLCHRCGREFPSDVSLGEQGIRSQLLDGVYYECPHCGTRDPYFTAEHHLPESGGFAAARSSGPRWSEGTHPRSPRYRERRPRLGA